MDATLLASIRAFKKHALAPSATPTPVSNSIEPVVHANEKQSNQRKQTIESNAINTKQGSLLYEQNRMNQTERMVQEKTKNEIEKERKEVIRKEQVQRKSGQLDTKLQKDRFGYVDLSNLVKGEQLKLVLNEKESDLQEEATSPDGDCADDDNGADATVMFSEETKIQEDKKKKKKKKKDNGKEAKKYERENLLLVDKNEASLAMGAYAGFLLDRIPSPLVSFVFLMGFLSALDMTIIFPSLASYFNKLGASQLYYGIVAGSYNFGQILSAPILGWWTDYRSMKEVLLFCSFASAAGNLIYFFGDEQHLFLLVVGRVVSGLGGGCVMVAYAHIARVTSKKEERNEKLSTYAWVVRLGQIIGPSIGALATLNSDRNLISVYTLPALINLCIFGTLFIGQVYHFVLTHQNVSSQMYHTFLDPMEDPGLLDEQYSFLKPELLVLLVVFYAHTISYWSYMAAVVPFLESQYGYSLEQSYLYFLFIGAMLAISFGIFLVLSRLLSAPKILIFSLLCSALGLGCAFNFSSDGVGQYQLGTSTALLVIGYCTGTILIPAMYNTLIGIKMENLGFRQSGWFAFLSIAMVIGPFWGAVASILDPAEMVLVSWSGLVMLLLTIVVLLFVPIHPQSTESTTLVEGAATAVEIPLVERAELNEALLISRFPRLHFNFSYFIM